MCVACSQTKELQTSIPIKGLDIKPDGLCVWNGRQAEIYAISNGMGFRIHLISDVGMVIVISY